MRKQAHQIRVLMYYSHIILAGVFTILALVFVYLLVHRINQGQFNRSVWALIGKTDLMMAASLFFWWRVFEQRKKPNLPSETGGS